MAYQKKCYRSSAVNSALTYVPVNGRGHSHQSRGNGTVKPAQKRANPKRYQTRPLKDTMPDPSPTFLAARAGKTLKV